MPEWSFKIDRPDIGQTENLAIVNVYEDGRETSSIGEPGLYSITFILGEISHTITDSNISLDVIKLGDSFLQFWSPELRNKEQTFGAVVTATNPDGSQSRCEIRTNSEGRMSQLVFPEIFGENFEHAETIAYSFVQPMLSWLSYQYDIPFEVNQVYSLECSSSTERTTTYISPKVKARANDKLLLPITMPPPLMECIGQYHEALKSVNEFYRLFCLFRSAEGLRHIRTKLDDIARKNNLLPLNARLPKKRVPTDLAIQLDYTQLANKTLLEARDYLWNEIRSHLAHLDFETGKFLSLHSYEEIIRVRRIIPLLQFIVKNFLTEEIYAHDEIKSRLGVTLNFLTWDEGDVDES